MQSSSEIIFIFSIIINLTYRAHFREQIFELGEKMNFMKMIHYVILLVLLNK